MKKYLLTCAVISLIVTGCGGGGGSSSTSSSVSGYVLPTEISAVPADNTATPSGFVSGIRALASGVAVTDLAATSDYNKAKTKKYVEERALEQFDIIEQVLNALSQTNYADAENVGAAAYTAMVAWVEDRDGREQKTLEPWVVQSSMIVENGRNVNRAIAWIEEPDYDNPGMLRTVKAEFKIYASANVNADGSYADYGEWDLNVSFDDSATSYFAASSTIANGVNTIKIHEKGLGEGGPGTEMKGILVRSGTSGYGKVQYPEYDFCWQPGAPDPCTPPVKTAQYAYNADYLAVDPDITTIDPVYKDRDRTNAVEMTHRYGLFYADADANLGIAAGDNVEKHKSFGFPVSYTDGNNLTSHAYYGAWQGRHELWIDQGATLPAGTTVTREDFGSDSVTQYTVSDKFNGTLTKRTLVDGDLNDIKGIPVETYINDHYDLNYDGTKWVYCDGWMDWSGPTCKDFSNNPIAMTDFTPNLGSLVVVDGDRKWINIGRWDGSQNVEYIYLTSASTAGENFTVAGFYPAQRDNMTGRMTAIQGANVYAPALNDGMYVDVGGSIYIQYTGDFTGGATGWVQKELSSWDERNYRPVFNDAGDTPFSPERDGEYYIHNNGANFVVRRIANLDAASSYETKIELQTAANPVNVASILPTGTSYLATPWRPEVRFSLVTTPTTDPNFMKLVYVTDDPNTGDVDESVVTTPLTSGEWGLQAYNASNQPLKADGTVVVVDEFGFPDPAVYTTQAEIDAARPTEFNWEYSEGGWGSQQFLIDTNSNYVMLSDPIPLNPITVGSKTLSLQFDGWMHGLPDMYQELAKNDFQMTADLASKVINIPADTAVTDSSSVNYYMKPMEVSIFLNVVASPAVGKVFPDFTEATAVDLTTVPTFTDHGMGAKPTGTTVKYSEGKPVS